MRVSVEKTVKQKLSQWVVDNASAVSIVHLPHNSLAQVLAAATDINQRAGISKAIPHIAARSVRSQEELEGFIAHAQSEGIDRVLIVGGNPRTSYEFQTAFDVNDWFTETDIKTLTGVYPERDTEAMYAYRKYWFDGGITQLCLNPYKLQQYDAWTTPAIPTMCSAQGLWNYMKLCGLRDSFEYMLQNWRGIFYLGSEGFDTVRFIRDVGERDYHLFNFGQVEKTLDKILTTYN